MNEDLAELQEEIGNYRVYISGLVDDSEEYQGSKMILGTVERFVRFLKSGDLESARNEAFLASRQITDTYFTHPPMIKRIGMLLSRLTK